MVKAKSEAPARKKTEDNGGDGASTGPEPGRAPAAPTTPPDLHPVPEAHPTGELPSGPAYFLNRELTWLNFNFRVLSEAEDERTPLLERIKFISIVGSNLDEFVMKRNLESRVEVLAPVEKDELRLELRHLLDTQLGDRRSAWEMRPDGSYVQLRPSGDEAEVGSQEALIAWHENRAKQATRLRRRESKVIRRSNVR